MLHICLFGRSNIILFDDIYWNPYPCKKLPLNVSCNMFYSYQWHNDPYHEWHFMHLIWTVAQISEEWNCSWLWIIWICNAFPILNVSHITSSYYIQFTCSWILCVCVCVCVLSYEPGFNFYFIVNFYLSQSRICYRVASRVNLCIVCKTRSKFLYVCTRVHNKLDVGWYLIIACIGQIAVTFSQFIADSRESQERKIF